MNISLSDKPFRACHQGPTGGQEKKYKVYCPPWPQDTPTQPAVPTRLPMGKSEVCTSRGQGSPGRADDLPRTQARTGQDWAVGVTRTRRGAFSICPSSPNPGRYIKTYIVFCFIRADRSGGAKGFPSQGSVRLGPARCGRGRVARKPSTQRSRPKGQTECGGIRSRPGLQAENQGPPSLKPWSRESSWWKGKVLPFSSF